MEPMTAYSQRVLDCGKSPIAYLMEQGVENADVISLAAGLVDQESLPVEMVRAAVERVLSNHAEGCAALQYGTTEGDRRLRELLVDHLARLDGCAPAEIGLHPERIIVGTGSQQLLYLVGEILLNPGDLVLMGVPGYFVYMGALESLGAKVVPIETDIDGLIPEAVDEQLATLERQGELARVKLIYDVSYFNNPTGWSLSAARRRELVAVARRWSKRQRIYILEDAAYRELRYSGSDLPSMLRFDPSGEQVLYAGTFSKPLSPGLKTGYLVAPAELISPLVYQKGHHDFGSSNFTHRILAELLASGDYMRHLDRLRQIYGAKLALMLRTLTDGLAELDGEVAWTQPEGGLYVWLKTPARVSAAHDSTFFRRCLESGVLFVPGEYCYPRSHAAAGRQFVRLSFGVQPPERIREGVERFCRVLAELAR